MDGKRSDSRELGMYAARKPSPMQRNAMLFPMLTPMLGPQTSLLYYACALSSILKSLPPLLSWTLSISF